jgi:hypothetical protein
VRGSRLLLMPALITLGGCVSTAGMDASPPTGALPETIAVSVGPCFGFCPVYDVAISPNGDLHFSGKRNTAEIGDRDRRAGIRVYREIVRDLAAFRPADGTTERVECDAAISDTSPYTITWTAADGRRTVATHQLGCAGGPGKALDAVLATLSERLGVDRRGKRTPVAG